MARINISLNVPDSLVENVITPAKKDGKLNRLLGALLEGYLSDDYIKAYVEGDLTQLQDDRKESLKSRIAAAQESLRAAEFHNESAEHIANTSKNRNENIARGEEGGSGSDELNIHQKVDDMATQLQSIMALLQGGGVNINAANSPAARVSVVEEVQNVDEEVSLTPVRVSSDILTSPVDNFPEPVETRAPVVDTDDDDDDDDDVMGGYTSAESYGEPEFASTETAVEKSPKDFVLGVANGVIAGGL